MKQGNYQAIIFDLYGVLVANSWQEFKQRHFGIGTDDWQTMIELGRKVDAGTASYDTFIEYIADHTGETASAVRSHLEHNEPNEPLLHYIQHHLQHTYKLGVLSNASTNRSLRVFSPQQNALFNEIVLSRDVGYTKPQAEMYHLMASRLGVRPEQCVYIDDQQVYVSGAEAVGMTGVVYTDVAELIEKLRELLA